MEMHTERASRFQFPVRSRVTAVAEAARAVDAIERSTMLITAAEAECIECILPNL